MTKTTISKINRSALKVFNILSPILGGLFVMFLSSPVANASVETYTLTMTWDSTNCRILMNGSAAILTYTVAYGDSLNTTVVNNTGYNDSVNYAISSGGSFYKNVNAGTNDSESFTSSQTTVSVYPYVDGYGGGPACQETSSGTASFVTGSPKSSGGGGSSASPSTTVKSTGASASSKTPTASSASTPASATSNSAKSVQLSSVDIAGKAAQSTSNLILKQSQSLTLHGTTTPNGLVTLTIHSTPHTVTTNADNLGNWQYVVTHLTPGSHTIDATVTDPTSKQMSPSSQLLAFKVTAAATAVSKVAYVKTNWTPLILLIALSLIVAAGLIFLFIKRNRKSFVQAKVLSNSSVIAASASENQNGKKNDDKTMADVSGEGNKDSTEGPKDSQDQQGF